MRVLLDECVSEGLRNYLAGRGAVQCYFEANGLPSLVAANTKCKSRAWNRNTILPGAA
jgi:hypothetical protein